MKELNIDIGTAELVYTLNEDTLLNEAYIEACELCGPNSPEFEQLWEDIFDEMMQSAMISYASLESF